MVTRGEVAAREADGGRGKGSETGTGTNTGDGREPTRGEGRAPRRGALEMDGKLLVFERGVPAEAEGSKRGGVGGRRLKTGLPTLTRACKGKEESEVEAAGKMSKVEAVVLLIFIPKRACMAERGFEAARIWTRPSKGLGEVAEEGKSIGKGNCRNASKEKTKKPDNNDRAKPERKRKMKRARTNLRSCGGNGKGKRIRSEAGGGRGQRRRAEEKQQQEGKEEEAGVGAVRVQVRSWEKKPGGGICTGAEGTIGEGEVRGFRFKEEVTGFSGSGSGSGASGGA